mmetsp:Transcript_20484/g.49870  ORF Transcript_20484/g.49870 Transcript_20484/m.49870 type:complete len:99 (+) Transcript_20484:44-340(+)
MPVSELTGSRLSVYQPKVKPGKSLSDLSGYSQYVCRSVSQSGWEQAATQTNSQPARHTEQAETDRQTNLSPSPSPLPFPMDVIGWLPLPPLMLCTHPR